MSTSIKTEKKDDGHEVTEQTAPAAKRMRRRRRGPLSVMRSLFERDPDLRDRSGLGEILYMPDIEVMQRGTKLVVKADLPGMSPEDVRVTIDEDSMIIEGERRSDHEEEAEGVWRCERSYGRFQRVIPLPDGAEPDSAEARFDNGVLEIAVEAPTPSREARDVEITVGPAAKGSH